MFVCLYSRTKPCSVNQIEYELLRIWENSDHQHHRISVDKALKKRQIKSLGSSLFWSFASYYSLRVTGWVSGPYYLGSSPFLKILFICIYTHCVRARVLVFAPEPAVPLHISRYILLRRINATSFSGCNFTKISHTFRTF